MRLVISILQCYVSKARPYARAIKQPSSEKFAHKKKPGKPVGLPELMVCELV